MLSMKSLITRIQAIVLALIVSVGTLQAKEGMWIPYLIGAVNADDMTAMGMEISAEDIYSINNSSLKDAIVHFGGGCTAELISKKGLLLTNHHCGYSQIQSHSSLQNDYLKNGFWAMNGKEELKNPGLTAAIVKYMREVTNQALMGVTATMPAAEREAKIQENIKSIIEAQKEPYEYEVKAFYYGNQYILIAKEVFKDVRLVGAPPSSIGKYGADTDNWVWPRHTGDFSIFRVYADKENQPAEYSEENVPYTPLRHLMVNLGGTKPNDFTMVYGFPGTTNEYLPSNEIANIVNDYDPARIAVRDALLAILDKKMRENDETRIKYASKYARISNAWKKWQGEVLGLTATDAVGKKQKMEEQFEEAIAKNDVFTKEYSGLLKQMKSLYDERKPLTMERYMYLETMYYGNELVKHLLGYRGLVKLYEDGKDEELATEAAKFAERLDGFYKDYDVELDRQAMHALLPVYLKAASTEPLPEYLKSLKGKSPEQIEKYVNNLYAKALPVKDSEAWKQMLKENPKKAIKSLNKSDAMKLTMAGWDHFINVVNPKTRDYEDRLDVLQRKYLLALSEVFPTKMMYPDANSTLRVAYGKVHGYEPRDGVEYATHTYLDGVIEKYIPGDYEFDLPQKMLDLYNTKDYGRYADGDKMPVCFIASNHTTGGNSGSPALNGRGELIGLNFDRTWEGTMSDYNYDVSLCRNIMVDIRYVLFIVDKFAGAGYLVDEMDIVVPAIEEKKKEPVDMAPIGK